MNRPSPPPRHRSRSLGLLWIAALLPAVTLALTDCDDESEPPAEPEPPLMTHGSPNEAAEQMCVVCHTCGDDGTGSVMAPIISNGTGDGPPHDVCNACHAEDGAVEVHGEEACEWEMDCDMVPPLVNCNSCHTVEYVNDLCETCHDPDSVSP